MFSIHPYITANYTATLIVIQLNLPQKIAMQTSNNLWQQKQNPSNQTRNNPTTWLLSAQDQDFTRDTKSSIKQKYLGIQKQVNNPTKPNGIMETIGKLNQSPPEKRMPQQPCPPMREEKRNAIEGPGREIRTINTTRGEGKESLNGQIDIRTQERRT